MTTKELIELAARLETWAPGAQLRVTLRDARGVVVETIEGDYGSVSAWALRFMYLQGTDPDEGGHGATGGSIQFEPVAAGDSGRG